ncbi:initiator tRNA phosphoribosyl transferase family protein [Striga asiatica]|uniref:Initiator tRNA phosphoribosyl transferase family protein n=1 Tax=Striga asiatica TaxID=4170 RepID=A0A5A7PZF4_STRAF|nr:initiator tRNA phosphoribosyl transferase family protein [Striga asiatica]
MKSSLILWEDPETPNSQGDSPNRRSLKTEVGIFGSVTAEFGSVGGENPNFFFTSSPNHEIIPFGGRRGRWRRIEGRRQRWRRPIAICFAGTSSEKVTRTTCYSRAPICKTSNTYMWTASMGIRLGIFCNEFLSLVCFMWYSNGLMGLCYWTSCHSHSHKL